MRGTAMGLIDRWKAANRRSKFGKELAGSGLTGTKQEKRVIQHIGELIAEVEEALSAVQTLCDSDTRHWVARNIYQLVLQAPRGAGGHHGLSTYDMQLRAARDIRHTAPWIASLLVLADH